MKCISASDMRSKEKENKSDMSYKSYGSNNLFLVALYSSLLLILLATVCRAEVIDRVVAYVDDTAITLAEFQRNYARMREAVGTAGKEEALNSMINSLLLLKEARKMRLEAPSKDELLREYVDIKIRAAVIIKEEDIERFYRDHINDFNGKDYVLVRDEIEKYLFELETNRLLKRHLEDLRSRAEIKMQLNEGGGTP